MVATALRRGRAGGADPDPVGGIESALAALLRLTGSARVHDARARVAGLRISRTELSFLGWLSEHGPTPVSRLAERADVSQPAASRALGRLGAAGLVARASDQRDGRVNLMVLTPAGTEALAKNLVLMRRQLSTALGGMTLGEQRTLAELLERLVAGLRASDLAEPGPRAER